MYLCFNYRTPWSRLFLKKLILIRLIKNSPTFYGTQRFIAVYRKVGQWLLFKVTRIQSTPSSYCCLVHFNTLLWFKNLFQWSYLFVVFNHHFYDFPRVLIKTVWPPSSMSNRKQRFGSWISCFSQVWSQTQCGYPVTEWAASDLAMYFTSGRKQPQVANFCVLLER